MVAIKLLYLTVSLNSLSGQFCCGVSFGLSCCHHGTVSVAEKRIALTFPSTPTLIPNPFVTCSDSMVLFGYNNRELSANSNPPFIDGPVNSTKS
jgi:hypothetical protein